MAPMVGDYPAWLCQNSNGKWPIKIVDFPSWKMVDLSIAMLVYQRVYGFYGFLQHYMGLYGIIWDYMTRYMGMGQNPGTFCSPQVIAGIYGCE